MVMIMGGGWCLILQNVTVVVNGSAQLHSLHSTHVSGCRGLYKMLEVARQEAELATTLG